MIDNIETILRRLLGRSKPVDPALIGTRQLRQRLDQMSLSSVSAYNSWLIERGRSPCIMSLDDYFAEKRLAAGLIFPARALDSVGHRLHS